MDEQTTTPQDDVYAHMIKVPFGKRESIDEDEDVRAHVAGTPGRPE